MKIMRWLFKIGILWIVIFSGCASSYQRDFVDVDVKVKKLGKVAILPFINLTDYPQAGKIVTSLMTTEIYSTKKFQHLMSPGKVKKLLQIAKFDETKWEDIAYLQEIGKILKVDFLILGSVSEYRYKKGLGEEPVVGINGRMIRLKDGKVLWASSHSSGGEYFWFSHDSLNRLSQEICYNMVYNLVYN